MVPINSGAAAPLRVFPAVRAVREAARRQEVRDNLTRLALGLARFQERGGSLRSFAAPYSWGTRQGPGADATTFSSVQHPLRQRAFGPFDTNGRFSTVEVGFGGTFEGSVTGPDGACSSLYSDGSSTWDCTFEPPAVTEDFVPPRRYFTGRFRF